MAALIPLQADPSLRWLNAGVKPHNGASPCPAPAVTTPTEVSIHPAVDVRHSGIHGSGVFARKRLAAGSRIGRYDGRRYSAEQAAARDWDHALTYVFGLSDGSVIDGSAGGNATRLINHSCAPNCAAYEVEDERGTLHIEIETLRPIKRGEELFIDYKLGVEQGDPASFGCRCGAAACRGTMLAPD